MRTVIAATRLSRLALSPGQNVNARMALLSQASYTHFWSDFIYVFSVRSPTSPFATLQCTTE